MNINNSNASSINYANSTQSIKQYSDNGKASTHSPEEVKKTDSVLISPEAKWQQISDKYDLTNISGNEVMTMAKELYDNNLISANDMLSMYVPESMDFDPSQKSNHLENMKKDFNMMKGYGGNSPEAIEHASNILEMLKRIG